jgi:hypothetical protein
MLVKEILWYTSHNSFKHIPSNVIVKACALSSWGDSGLEMSLGQLELGKCGLDDFLGFGFVEDF